MHINHQRVSPPLLDLALVVKWYVEGEVKGGRLPTDHGGRELADEGRLLW